MTDLEIADFWKQCFIQFPTLKSWLRENSPDMPATLAVWSGALRKITAQEALSVLSRWSRGDLEPPTGYQRETFHLHVRSVVMADRSKNAGKRLREEAFAKANIGNRRPRILVSCREVMDRIIAEKAKYEQGLITQAELEEAKERIVREAHDEIDSRHERRAVG